jgi:ParB family chromosome partitioning protein
VQPIIARPDAARGGFEIVAGERRWRAAQRAGVHQVPVIVRELADQEALEIAIIENVQRSDLNAIEGGGRLHRAGRALRLHAGAALRRDRQES